MLPLLVESIDDNEKEAAGKEKEERKVWTMEKRDGQIFDGKRDQGAGAFEEKKTMMKER